MLELLFILIQLGFAVYILYLCIAFVTGAPFVPSTDPVAKRMVELARITPGQTAYDLGSGDGRLIRLAAKEGARAIGLEINPFLVVYSNLKGLRFRDNSATKSLWRNFWNFRLTEADVVFVYLLPWRMDRLATKLKRELKPGSIIVTNSFIFPRWRILRQDAKLHVYVYKI